MSDSRLNGGGILDTVPKLFLLPRSDVVVGFSGTTFIAYPLLTQLIQAVTFHYPLRDRVIDYVPFRTYLVRLINELFRGYNTYIEDFQKPDTAFLLGGYSWFNKQFYIDKIFFNAGVGRWEYRATNISSSAFGKVAFVGDWAVRGRRQLNQLLRERFGKDALSENGGRRRYFNMEPFEVVRDLVRSADAAATIGGALQLASVSQHMNTRHTAVYWPSRSSGGIFLGGRQIFDFERIENWIIDPDSLEKFHLFHQDRAQQLPSADGAASGGLLLQQLQPEHDV